jgi:hypothetical protein
MGAIAVISISVESKCRFPNVSKLRTLKILENKDRRIHNSTYVRTYIQPVRDHVDHSWPGRMVATGLQQACKNEKGGRYVLSTPYLY